MPDYIANPIGEGLNGRGHKLAVGKYDFTVDGGAVSTIPLAGGTFIPAGVTIFGGFIDVTVAATSGGAATFGIQVEAAGDIVTAGTGFASLALGRRNIIPALATGAATANTLAVRTSVPRDISLVIAAAALTAGKFSVVLFYIDPIS